jgi:hypothetical protein
MLLARHFPCSLLIICLPSLWLGSLVLIVHDIPADSVWMSLSQTMLEVLETFQGPSWTNLYEPC